jgi:hypothetical protein
MFCSGSRPKQCNVIYTPIPIIKVITIGRFRTTKASSWLLRMRRSLSCYVLYKYPCFQEGIALQRFFSPVQFVRIDPSCQGSCLFPNTLIHVEIMFQRPIRRWLKNKPWHFGRILIRYMRH